MQYRMEKDSLGERKVPANVYYGVQTLRASENFPITGVPIHKELVVTLAEVKKAAALSNIKTKMLPEEIGQAIIEAAHEVIQGNFFEHFIVDSIQGGAGTSINMNMNEVLANRALEMLGRNKGEYFYCSPNSHVNMSQSTNDTIPTAIKMAAFRLTQELITSLASLQEILIEKEQEFREIIKMGRTHLQDAVPVRLGQEFGAYAKVVHRDIRRISEASQEMLTINMGATAVGTGLNAKPQYITEVTTQLSNQLGIELGCADDLVDATQNTDVYTTLSAALKISGINLSKICNDIRLMASGPFAGLDELNIPPRQPGSSIMPGKVNPVMMEVVNQAAFQVAGNDQAICMASEAGQFELNVMGPVISTNLLQSLKVMKNSISVLNQFALSDIKANYGKCNEYVEKSYGIITALNPHLGYEMATRLVKESVETGLTIKDLCLEHQLLTEKELENILDPHEMTSPGIAGGRFLESV